MELAKINFLRKLLKKVIFFFKKPSERVSTFELLRDNIESLLIKISWKKSMRWEVIVYIGETFKVNYGCF